MGPAETERESAPHGIEVVAHGLVELGQAVTVASAVVQPVAVHDDDLRSADLPGKQVMAIHLTRLEHLLGPAAITNHLPWSSS